MNAGIYCVENTSNKKIYIGQSKNIEKRLKDHKRLLRDGKHYNVYLQNSYNKFGKENFLFRVLEKIDDLELLNVLENKWIGHYKSFLGINGYNVIYPTQVHRQLFKEIIWKKCKICGEKYGLYKHELDYKRFLYQNLCSKECQREFWRIHLKNKDEISF